MTGHIASGYARHSTKRWSGLFHLGGGGGVNPDLADVITLQLQLPQPW